MSEGLAYAEWWERSPAHPDNQRRSTMRIGDRVRVTGELAEGSFMPDGACEGMEGVIVSLEDAGSEQLARVELPESPYGYAEFLESELELVR